MLRLSDALDIDKTRLPRVEDRNHELISDVTRKEYKKLEIVQRVAVDPNEGNVLVQMLISKSDPESVENCKEVKKKLFDEFESVRSILLNYGIKINNIKFLICSI